MPGSFFWWRYGDSNPTPLACHASALPNELYPRVFIITQGGAFCPIFYAKQKMAVISLLTLLFCVNF